MASSSTFTDGARWIWLTPASAKEAVCASGSSVLSVARRDEPHVPISQVCSQRERPMDRLHGSGGSTPVAKLFVKNESAKITEVFRVRLLSQVDRVSQALQHVVVARTQTVYKHPCAASSSVTKLPDPPPTKYSLVQRE